MAALHPSICSRLPCNLLFIEETDEMAAGKQETLPPRNCNMERYLCRKDTPAFMRGLLDHAACVYGPDGVIFVCKILISGSKLRPGIGFGTGTRLLDGSVCVDQIAGAV